MIRHPAGLPAELAGIDRTLVLGILNVTPDSFSDGGRFASSAAAVAAGVELHRRGADIIDVGGESTRPGAERIAADVELARVLDVVAGLAEAGVPVSIDTMRAEVADGAVAAGASIVNDVSGGLGDPDMLPLVADLAAPYIAMHWRGHSADMDDLARYDDVVAEVTTELAARLEACAAAGVDLGRVVLDPGLGFAKTAAHNWALLAGLADLAALGRPLLVGASRKRFLGDLLADGSGAPRDVARREAATVALTTLAARTGVWAVRVHDAEGSADAVRVVEAMGGSAGG